jgi:hypothetical protein
MAAALAHSLFDPGAQNAKMNEVETEDLAKKEKGRVFQKKFPR